MILRVVAAFGLSLLATTSLTLAQPTDKVVAAYYPPLMIDTSEDRPGYAVEVLREAARRTGRQVNITFLPFERAIHTMQRDEATFIPSLFHGKADDHLYNWVVEIQRARLQFSTVTGRIDDLETARAARAIVLEAGTTGDALLTKLGFTNLIRTHSPESSARMLEAGRADAWLLTERLMGQVWGRLNIATELTFGNVVHEVPICLVASPAMPKELLTAYREAVVSMKADGTLVRLQARYGLQ